MKLLSTALALSITLFSAGPGAASAAAQVLRTGPVSTPVVPVAPAGLAAPTTLSLSPLSPTLSAPTLAAPVVGLTPNAVATPKAVAASVALPSAAASKAVAAALAAPAAQAAAPMASEAALPRGIARSAAAKPETVLGSLSAGAETLGRSRPAERGAVLENIFTGAKVRGAANAAVDASGAESSGRSLLQPALSAADLEAAAADSSKPLSERKAAVASIARLGGDAAKDSLGRAADANPEGGADDYEVHRAALKVLAEDFGVVRSLRAVSRAHADQILARLADQKPAMAVFDFDDTLEAWKAKASPETGAALKAASDAGVRVAVLTDRPAEKDGSSPTILESLDTLTPEQKAAVTVAGRAGAEMVQYDAKGRPATVERLPAWTAAERAALEAAGKALDERFGTAEHEGKSGGITDYGFFRLLPVGIPQATLDAAMAFLRAELEARGLKGLHVTGRFAKSPQDPPYVQVSKINKQRGMSILAGSRAAYERLADLRALGLPAKAAAKVLSWLKRIPEARIPAQKTLIVGDQFFGGRSTDAEMAKAAPGALVISVGAKADPRLDNIFVWPSEGHSASMEVLGALAKKSDGGFNKKAVIGLFLGRTLSIGSFVLTAIAYPGVAAPAVGWAVFGTLMALGPLAAIATGPLNGVMADKLSARTAMTINMALRAVLALALPAFAYFGVLNFWTLLVASIANGWALSATMTTETAYVRRLAGKHQNAVQALIAMNFVALQVVLGLLIGVGSFIDQWNPVAPFLISAAIHGLVAVPLMLFTMPGDKPAAPKAAEPAKAKTPFFERASGFAKKYWKEAAITAAAIASFPLLHSALPIASALFYWVFQTDTVRALRRGDFREVSPREREIAEALKDGGRDAAETAALKKEANTWKRRQFMTVLYSAGQAVMTYPFQNFALPLIATLLMGAAGKGLLLGQLLGAMYFGNLIANSSQANLPEVRLPLLGRMPGAHIIKGLVLGMAAAWVYTGLVPGNILAAAAAVAVAAGLMWFSGRITNRGWIKMLGLGLASLALPATVWFFPGLIPFLSVQTALTLSMLAYGLFVGPSAVSLGIYQQNATNKADLGKVFGTSSSFFNTFNSLGYGLLALAAGALTPAFPMLFLPMGALYLIGGWFFWTAPKRLPGLPESSFEKKD